MNLVRERRAIFLIFLGLSLFGLLMVYEASSIYAWKVYHSSLYFFRRQLIFFLSSLFVFFIVLGIDSNFFRKYSFPILVFNILLLILVLIWGKKIGGARRWFSLFGFSFQPSEFLKISFILWCANYFASKNLILNTVEDVLPPLSLVFLISFFLLLEPDLGSIIFWFSWMIISLFLFKAKKRHLFLLMLIGTIVIFFLIKFYPYRFRRLIYFFNPWRDPKGAGFQLIQSQIAFGNGGAFGVGLGESAQKFLFLPAAHTDFIFSIIAEEFGFLGSVVFVVIYWFLFFTLFKMGLSFKDFFSKAFCMGASILLGLEVIINMGVSCGIFPTKGLPLPFISYGGSNLFVHYLLMGLVFRISKENENPSCYRI
ncbi:MAG: putative lipid II flippase FtsW [Candidatus Omnitrophica bacterium 4484_70.1]|nr:MAG: putative lipid II flippase FtsW [Candidatus Omnitrophica bacterium 4484_70.1]